MKPPEPWPEEKGSVTRATGTPSSLSVSRSLVTSRVGEVLLRVCIGPGADEPKGFTSFKGVCGIFLKVSG